MILQIEGIRLLVQEKDVPMRCTARWRSRSNPVRHEGSIELEDRRVTDCHVRLDPVQDWPQDSKRWERGIDVQADDHVFGIGAGAVEGELGWVLSFCVYCQIGFFMGSA